jgi:aerobic-type carbon monoxide dehydrogenase small subunit (CoxS/CutS family)
LNRSINIKINGKSYSDVVEDRLLLVNYIRDVAGLTGTHMGCDTGHCGACTIVMNGEAVKSCLILAVQAEGASVETVEGMASETGLHPLQVSFRKNFAVQCGFCTAGILMSALALLRNNPEPNSEDISKALTGNICRCEGYPNIVKAIEEASLVMKAAKDLGREPRGKENEKEG